MNAEKMQDVGEIVTTSRRQLLQAAGGVTLGASGLVLPGWLDEIDARGKRKNRRRHHGSKKDKKNDQETPRGGGASNGNRNVAIFVHNYRSVPVTIQAWQFDHYDESQGSGPSAQRRYATPAGWESAVLPARKADGSHSRRDFYCGRDRDVSEPRLLIVQIGTDRVVWCFNDPFWFPRGEIYTGSWSNEGWKPGGTLLGSNNFFVNESFSRDGIKITRLNDSQDHIQFSVDL